MANSEEIKSEYKVKPVSKEDLLDSNDDGIPDLWSINGYTVYNGKVLKWTKECEKLDLIKYKSNPFKKSTTGDPYTDIDKVLGRVDQAILPEARHPLVAAYPLVGLLMEKVILTKNISTTSEKGGTKNTETSKSVSSSTSNSASESTSIGVSVEAHSSFIDPFGASVTASYSTEKTNTVTTESSKSSTEGISRGESWTTSLNMNQAETAFLSGNIRYYNSATAPIYHLMPTLNFILGQGSEEQTVATIVAKTNTIVNCLLPNYMYPSAGQSAIAWNTSDDFNSQPIKLNYHQVQQLGVKGSKMQIQTTQVSGYYKKFDLDEEVRMEETQKWEYVFNEVYNNTACLTIIFNNGKIMQRRVAARKELAYDKQFIPEISLAEAIRISFLDAKVNNKTIKYQESTITSKGIVFVDKKQMNQLRSAIENENFDLENFKLKQGMNILFYENIKENEKIVENYYDQEIQNNIATMLRNEALEITIGTTANSSRGLNVFYQQLENKIKDFIQGSDKSTHGNYFLNKYKQYYKPDKIKVWPAVFKDNQGKTKYESNDNPFEKPTILSAFFNFKYTAGYEMSSKDYLPCTMNIIKINDSEIQRQLKESIDQSPIEVAIKSQATLPNGINEVVIKLQQNDYHPFVHSLPLAFQSSFSAKRIGIYTTYVYKASRSRDLENKFAKVGKHTIYFYIVYCEDNDASKNNGIYVPVNVTVNS